jgi:hypothetical protein
MSEYCKDIIETLLKHCQNNGDKKRYTCFSAVNFLPFILNIMFYRQKTNLQVIISKDLEYKSKKAAAKMGFNNIPEMVRSMLVSVTKDIPEPVDTLPFADVPLKIKLRNGKEIYKSDLRNMTDPPDGYSVQEWGIARSMAELGISGPLAS